MRCLSVLRRSWREGTGQRYGLATTTGLASPCLTPPAFFTAVSPRAGSSRQRNRRAGRQVRGGLSGQGSGLGGCGWCGGGWRWPGGWIELAALRQRRRTLLCAAVVAEPRSGPLGEEWVRPARRCPGGSARVFARRPQRRKGGPEEEGCAADGFRPFRASEAASRSQSLAPPGRGLTMAGGVPWSGSGAGA